MRREGPPSMHFRHAGTLGERSGCSAASSSGMTPGLTEYRVPMGRRSSPERVPLLPREDSREELVGTLSAHHVRVLRTRQAVARAAGADARSGRNDRYANEFGIGVGVLPLGT